MRTSLFGLAVLFIAMAPLGDRPFPKIEGETLDGKAISLPQGPKTFALVGVAASVKAQADLESWMQPVYTEVMNGQFFVVKTYMLVLADGIKGVGKDQIAKQLKTKIPNEFHQYLMISEVSMDAIKGPLKLVNRDEPYFYVIDPLGKIIYETSGEYTEKKMEGITDALSE